MLGEEAIRGAPILELGTGGSEQASDGVSAEAKQGTQGERLGAVGETLLVEAGAAVAPEFFELGEDTGRVFFKAGGGASRRRRASRALSSTIHSTVSPRENSMAWATAEGKLMYHCSLDLRLMSWTLVGNPMRRRSL